MKTRFYAIMSVLVISGFLAGFQSGQFWAEHRVRRIMRQRPEHLEQMLLKRLADRLHLTDRQIPQVQEMTRQFAMELEASFKTHRKAIDERVAGLLTEIRPILDPEQQGILDRMTAEDLRPGPPSPHGRGPRMPPPGNRRPIGGPPTNDREQIVPGSSPTPPFRDGKRRPNHGEPHGEAMSEPGTEFHKERD